MLSLLTLTLILTLTLTLDLDLSTRARNPGQLSRGSTARVETYGRTDRRTNTTEFVTFLANAVDNYIHLKALLSYSILAAIKVYPALYFFVVSFSQFLNVDKTVIIATIAECRRITLN